MAIEKHDTTENTLVPVSEKYTLTIKEAASYFNIGTKKNLSVLLRRYNSVCLPKVVDIISVQSDI